jgi:carbon monoxide dehydrogenase subunit G
MEMTGEQLIPVSQDTVWRGLFAPEVLKECITGCESVEKVSDTEYKVALTAAVGPVKARFVGKLVLSELDPPHSCSLAFEGSGGAAGFGKGSAQVKLTSEGASTRLAYATKASVGGKLAQIGSRLIDGVARKMADDFFVKFNQVMAAPAAAPAAADRGAAVVPTGAAVPEEAGSLPLWIVAGTIIAMVVIAWLMR